MNQNPDQTLLAVERNYLAAERTFLAWIRTGLAGVGGGLIIVRFLSFERPIHQTISYLLGVAFVLWGIAIFILALVEYERISARLQMMSPSLKLAVASRRAIVLMLLLLSFAILFLAL